MSVLAPLCILDCVVDVQAIEVSLLTTVTPAIELTTSHADDGVVYAKCDVTHEDLKVVDGKLWSEELRKVVNRKISKHYGKIQV